MKKGLKQINTEREEILEGENVEGGIGALLNKGGDISPREQKPSGLQMADKHLSEVADLVKDFLEIRKTKAQTEQIVAEMEQKRKAILDAAEADVARTNAKTRQIVEPMDKVLHMLQELQSNKLLTPEGMKECILALFQKL